LKWLLLLRVFLLSLFLGISSLLQSSYPALRLPPALAIAGFCGVIYLFSIASAAVLNRFPRLENFAYGQIITDSVFTTVMIYYSGGSDSIFTFLYFFPIISAGLMLFRRGGLVVAGLNMVNYGLVLSSQYIVWAVSLPLAIRPNAATAPTILLQNFLIYSFSFVLVALLSALLAERLAWTETALHQTSRHLDFLSQLYKQIFDDISSGIITVDAQGKITSFNRAAETMTGYAAFEVMDRHLGQIFPALLGVCDGAEHPTTELRRKDQSSIPIGYSWSRLNLPEQADDCRVYTLRDLSRIRQMEEQVRQSEKMAAIGKIAAGIAHEFRNPLAAISGAAQVLDQDAPPSSTSHSLLNIISRECSRLEANISDFLQFSRPAVPEQAWIPLAALLDECWTVIQQNTKFNHHCRLQTSIPTHLDCWADHHQLTQVFLNLIHNACLSMEQGGLIEISAQEESTGDGRAVIAIAVKDSGCGIPEAMQADIFAPFFTTRENGTGLGLAIVQQIIEGHQGLVGLTSEVGVGTTFTVRLPLPQ